MNSLTVLPAHKTRIVATIGPASESREMLERLILAGMNIARLNLSHGDFSAHAEVIRRLREAERATSRTVAILADLPGPKMRLGRFASEPIELKAGDAFTLTSEEIVGDATRASMSFKSLSRVVKPGDRLFLNDGLVQLTVESVKAHDVHCRVTVGGELRSRKGLNLPGIDLGASAFTDHDRDCLEFAVKAGVDAVSQSFVERAADLQTVRDACARLGRQPFLIAKIERLGALTHFDELLQAADGIMVARGDLGVEVPLEGIAVTQKQLISKCNTAGKPVITATQLLESMVASRLPTRAEATDVANAILDGTDAVMLSGESAMGQYPEEAVAMLARIAAATEGHRPPVRRFKQRTLKDSAASTTTAEAMSSVVEHALEIVPFDAVFVPTKSGATARMISRYKLPSWIVATHCEPDVLRALQFSYGVTPTSETPGSSEWREFAGRWLRAHGVPARRAMLVAGPSPASPLDNYRIEFMDVQPEIGSQGSKRGVTPGGGLAK